MAPTLTFDDSLSDRTTVIETLLNHIQRTGTKNVSLKRNRDPVKNMGEEECNPRKSLERLQGPKKRKIASEVNLERRTSLDYVEIKEEALVTVTEHVESLGVTQAEARSINPTAFKTLEEIESREQRLKRAHELLALRERKVDEIASALDERTSAVEDREKEFSCFLEEKKKEIELKEEELRLKLENEKLREQQKLKVIDETVRRLISAENKLEGMRANLDKRLEEIERRENAVWESAALSVKEGHLITESLEKQLEEFDKVRSKFYSFEEEKMRELKSREQLVNEMSEKADLVRESLQKQLEEFEKKESEFNSFQEKKVGELNSVEQLLNKMSEKAAEDAKLRKEELIREGDSMRESLQIQLQEFEKAKSKFNSFQEEKMRELNSKEQQLNEMSEKVALMRESLQKQSEEFVKKESEFNSFQAKKMGELDSKEQLLNEMSKKVAEDAKLTIEKLIRRERIVHQLLKRLELAKDNVEGLKDVVHQRFKSLVSKENDLNSTSDWVEKRMDEADLKAKNLEVKENSMQKIENEITCMKHELRNKERKLARSEQNLQVWQAELEVKQKEVNSAQVLNGRRSEKLDAREKSMRELTGKCFKEHQAKKKEVALVKDLVEKVARFLGLEDENLKNAIRELEFRERRMIGHVEVHELIHQPSSDNSNGHVRKELYESADLKFTVRMDGKNLQMFLNDPEKNLVSMGDEIFKVLHLSSDPAKLVLDAMVGFYPPHLREGDTAVDVRKTCVALLMQLMRMSREIKPCVREEAMQVALAWKSKMAENPSTLEVLGFLLLLAVYNVGSSFSKDEISALLMMVSLHREEAPELDSVRGLTEALTGIMGIYLESGIVAHKQLKNAGMLDKGGSGECS